MPRLSPSLLHVDVPGEVHLAVHLHLDLAGRQNDGQRVQVAGDQAPARGDQ